MPTNIFESKNILFPINKNNEITTKDIFQSLFPFFCCIFHNAFIYSTVHMSIIYYKIEGTWCLYCYISGEKKHEQTNVNGLIKTIGIDW